MTFFECLGLLKPWNLLMFYLCTTTRNKFDIKNVIFETFTYVFLAKLIWPNMILRVRVMTF